MRIKLYLIVSLFMFFLDGILILMVHLIAHSVFVFFVQTTFTWIQQKYLETWSKTFHRAQGIGLLLLLNKHSSLPPIFFIHGFWKYFFFTISYPYWSFSQVIKRLSFPNWKLYRMPRISLQSKFWSWSCRRSIMVENIFFKQELAEWQKRIC